MLGKELVEAVYTDWQTAPVRTEVRAALGLIERLVKHPNQFGPADIAPLHSAGVPDADIENAIAVCSLFSMIVRVADALGFEVPSEQAFEQTAQRLLKHGYA